MIRFIEDPAERASIAEGILGDLPEWFGLPESTGRYVAESREQPFFAAANAQGEIVGFAALKATSPACAELAVIGVCKRCHGQGYGTALWEAFRAYAAAKGFTYVQVKTVESGHYPEYDATNAFYRHIGFAPLEVFPTLWDAWNPCQVYVQFIGQ